MEYVVAAVVIVGFIAFIVSRSKKKPDASEGTGVGGGGKPNDDGNTAQH